MRLLLISNSTNAGEQYLGHAKSKIRDFLGEKPVRALFIPYAAVMFSFDEYESRVRGSFREIGHDVDSIHRFSDPLEAVENASAIVVGGGNTWKLLKTIRDNGLIEAVGDKIRSGTPYIGWSAGSNVACPTIMTTNDMPVIIPDSMNAFNLVPFQINPHYLDANPAGHAGETREQRINEFIEMNPGTYVLGLREGTMLLIENGKISLLGGKDARLFFRGAIPIELSSKDDLSFLMK